MNGEQLLVVVFAVAGFCITGLLSAVAYFMSRMVTQFENSQKAQSEAIRDIDNSHGSAIAETNKLLHEAIASLKAAMSQANLATNEVITNLAHSLDKLSIAVSTLKEESTNRNKDFISRLYEHHEEIELCRLRIHDIYQYIQKIMAVGQLKCGWTFARDVIVPDAPVAMKKERPG